MRNSYSRPIPSPVHNLRPARDTCEQCHWPEKFHGDKVGVIREYGNDEKNTESVTRLLLHVGGGSAAARRRQRHPLAHERRQRDRLRRHRRQAADDSRTCALKDAEGNVHEYRGDGVTAEQLAKGERRRMDCMDCHNRPSHPFSASPERAVDDAIARGEIARDLPFVRREAVNVLKENYPTRTAAEKQIAQNAADVLWPELRVAGAGARQRRSTTRCARRQRVYGRNVFPAMNVTWGTHANNLGHMDSPGLLPLPRRPAQDG